MVTNQQWREFHYGKPEQKRKVAVWVLRYPKDNTLRNLAEGSFALCKHVQKQYPGAQIIPLKYF
jgi:hypothetical protein